MEHSQHSPHFPNSFYRVSVKGLCVQGDKILLMKEPLELSGQWELPGGGLHFGEDPRVGLEREIEEEMKLNVTFVAEWPTYVWIDRFERRRGMDWYYSVVLAYQVRFENIDFIPTKDCQAVAFYTKEELQSLDLFHQSLKLREVFNPADFTLK